MPGSRKVGGKMKDKTFLFSSLLSLFAQARCGFHSKLYNGCALTLRNGTYGVFDGASLFFPPVGKFCFFFFFFVAGIYQVRKSVQVLFYWRGDRVKNKKETFVRKVRKTRVLEIPRAREV